MEPMQAQMQPAQSVARTPDEKLHRRRVRRWKRRARIAGPFIGITILLAALSLSVDLIEYQPRKTADRLSDRPINVNARTNAEESERSHSYVDNSATSTLSVVPDRDPKIAAELLSLDLALPSTRVARAPTPPEAIR